MAKLTGDESGICERLRAVRETAFGPRGRAAFARALGLSPSTYIYYEKGRVPPPDVLARASELAAVRLQWLVTGQGPRSLSAREVSRTASAALPPELQVALDRFAERGDTSAAAVQALADILRSIGEQFPAVPGRPWEQQRLEQADGMIPILGRTAAGLVGTYQDLLGDEPAVTVADIARRALGLDVRLRPAAGLNADDPVLAGSLDELGSGVSLVQLAAPLASGVVEFVNAPALRSACPSAFALRVDGESMAPRFLHGDVAVAAAGRQVTSGAAALVQITGRVGVTLKLVRIEKDVVHLVPINETYDTERVAVGDIDWMAPVLLAVRFAPAPRRP